MRFDVINSYILTFFFPNVSVLSIPFMFVIGSGERSFFFFFSLSDMISYSCILVQDVKAKQASCRRAQMVMP